jgi:hypothetical protein
MCVRMYVSVCVYLCMCVYVRVRVYVYVRMRVWVCVVPMSVVGELVRNPPPILGSRFTWW